MNLQNQYYQDQFTFQTYPIQETLYSIPDTSLENIGGQTFSDLNNDPFASQDQKPIQKLELSQESIEKCSQKQGKGAQKAFRYRVRQKQLQISLLEENNHLYQQILKYMNYSIFSTEIQEIKLQIETFSQKFQKPDHRKNPRGKYQKISKEEKNSLSFKHKQNLKNRLNSLNYRNQNREKIVQIKEINQKLTNLDLKIQKYLVQNQIEMVDSFLNLDSE